MSSSPPTATAGAEISGLTTSLLVRYAEREGGPAAVEAMIDHAGLAGRAEALRDEAAWWPYETKLALLEGLVVGLDDPLAPRRAGAAALEMNIGAALKVALRNLGSPKLVYRSVAQANRRFSANAAMACDALTGERARLRWVLDDGYTPHALDCEYTAGLLSCVPVLFGLEPARVRHGTCRADGAAECAFDVAWASDLRVRRLLAGATGLLAAAAATASVAVPEAGGLDLGLALAAGGVAYAGLRRSSRRQITALRDELSERRKVAAGLQGALRELAATLDLDRLPERVIAHARRTLTGDRFCLLLSDERGLLHAAPADRLSGGHRSALVAWARRQPALRRDRLTISDVSEHPDLGPLRGHFASLSCAPLVVRDEGHGVLIALGRSAERFLPADEEALETFAAQVGIAIANARAYQAQQEAAARDALTGLRNHRSFHEQLGRELDRGRRYGNRFSVGLIDLNGFKAINDSEGHAAGDEVLASVARALQSACRGSDLPFRVGGDEFAVLLPDSGRSESEAALTRLVAGIGTVDARIEASWGVATWPDDAPAREQLLRLADERLYAMKGHRSAEEAAGAGDDSEAARRRLRMLSRLALRLGTVQDVDALCQRVADDLHRTFGFLAAVTMRRERDELVINAIAGDVTAIDPSVVGWRQSVDDGICGRVVRTGEPQLVNDTRCDADYVQASDAAEGRSQLSVPIRVGGEVWGVLDLESLEPGAFNDEDMLLAVIICEQLAGAIVRAGKLADREETFRVTLGVLGDALETKDLYTADHARAVAEIAERTGHALGLDAEDVRLVGYAALLHDVGKIAIPPEILNKPGRLTEEEFEHMKTHSDIGADMLARIPGLEDVAPMVRHSHERWDGDGYPAGLAGDDIPLGARIVAVCDALHAMTSDRPYRKAIGAVEAMAELERCAGTQFDPRVVEAVHAAVGAADAPVAALPAPVAG